MRCIKCGVELPDGAVYCHMCGKKQVPEKRRASRRTNGTGNAYKRGKTWTGRAVGFSYTEKLADGSVRVIRRRPTKGGFKTKTEALEWANSYNGTISPVSPTLASLWSGYSNNDMEKLSESKQIAYRKARERLEPIIGRQIDTLTIDDLQTVVNNRATSYYTARDMKTVLSKLYQRAMANKQATVNLSQFLVLPELEEKEAEAFTQEEVAKMWEAYEGGNIFVGYLLLLIYTGMMPAELKACKKNMIDREKCEIWGCGKKTKKRKKEIPIVFPDFITPVLDALCEYSPTEMLLDFGHNQFYDKYHETLREIGVRDFPPYSCRHTYGTEAVKGANSPEVVRQMLRHANILMQQRYTHLSPDAAHEAVNAMYH